MSGKLKRAETDAAFLARIVAAGGERLAATSHWEVMRFKTRLGVGVVYVDSKGARTWNPEAKAARAHLAKPGSGSLAPMKKNGAKVPAGTVERILARDGSVCFYCRAELGDDCTVEHLVARNHGGPNHISNLFLAHAPCNQRAGHLSAPEKIVLRDGWVCR